MTSQQLLALAILLEDFQRWLSDQYPDRLDVAVAGYMVEVVYTEARALKEEQAR